MELKIPVEVDLNGIDGIVDEIKHLQTYKLFEGDDMVLVSLDDVAEILINHIEAKRKSEPQRMRGRWIEPTEDNDYWECPVCHDTYELDVDVTPKDARLFFCPNCGADMRKEQEC